MPTDAGTLNEWANQIASTKLLILLIVHLILDFIIIWRIMAANARGDWCWSREVKAELERHERELEESKQREQNWKEIALPALNVGETLVGMASTRRRR